MNCTRFSEISTMPFIRGNARHAGRPPKCKVQISADNRGIKTKRILFLRGRRCNFWKVKAPFPAKLPMRCDSLRTVKAVQAPPHTVPLRRLQNRRQIPLKRQNIALTSPPPTHRHTQTHRHTDILLVHNFVACSQFRCSFFSNAICRWLHGVYAH